MFKRLVLLGIFVVFSTLPALADCIYVSTGSGHQILCVDPNTPGNVTVKFTGLSSFNPRDLVMGPDGNLYIADSDGGEIWRFDPNGSSLSPVATLSSGAPEGTSFSGSDNLYVTTRGGKPYRIANATTSPSATQLNVNSANWAGVGFGIPGYLLLVNQSQSQVYSSALPVSEPYTSANPLITSNLASPVGLAVNTCGDIMVASGNSIKRFSGGTPTTYVSFPGGDVVRYFEFTSANTAFVVTARADSGSRGKVWKVQPVVPTGGEAISSCTSGTATLLVELKDFSAGQNPVVATDQAIGLAVPATNATLTRSFGAGNDGVCATGDDPLPAQFPMPATNTFNFRHHSFQVQFASIRRCFSITMTAVMSKPSDVDSDDFASGVFPPTIRGLRYASKGGFVIEYDVPIPPSDTADYINPPNDSAYTVKIGYFTVEQFQSPGLAKGSNLGFYDTDITHDFWPSGAPGTDPEEGGEADGWSNFVVTNTGQTLLNCTYSLNQPALSGNPQFKTTQSISVKFECLNGPVPGLIARLSVALLNPFQTQPVVSKNNQNVENIFSSGSGNQYTYNVDASVLTPGILQFTIFSNGFPPQSFLVNVIP